MFVRAAEKKTYPYQTASLQPLTATIQCNCEA